MCTPTCWRNCFSSTDLLLIVLICSAAAEKAGPFNSDALSRLLDILVGHDRTGDTPSWSQSRQVRSPTSSPPPEGNSRFEAFCHDELVKAGGRPVVSFELLLDTFKDAGASKEILRRWLGNIDSGSRDGDVPPAFSTQLEDWESFQHKWQWDNRGKYASDEGFTAFLESRRKRCLHKGESEVVSDPSFGATARNRDIWSCPAERVSRHTRRRSRNALRLTNSRNHSSLRRIHASKTHGQLGWSISATSTGGGTGMLRQ